ncbi:hypothetical protein CHS0354_038756 [Potamilus streckersoni]|uniref:Uncharacterized protein n=1 Tax=Potamilus streckersoni TaxID=2493646 RepID=A0AAE0SRK2_9BIVA|nr:hypothetical protein CHS0354_038756 [Potamilus streckersoni]
MEAEERQEVDMGSLLIKMVSESETDAMAQQCSEQSYFRKSQHKDTELDEQIFATLYGQCIGDAIGLLTEFMSKKEAHRYYGHKKELEYGDKIDDQHRKRWEDGDWTDDSDQMILIMQSLTDKDGVVDPKDFARRLVHWKENGFKDLGDTCGLDMGHTTYAIVSRNYFEQYPHKASKDVWEESGGYLAPNGGVMRTSILGIHDWWDPNKVYANAIDICRTTHFDSRCQASAVAVCTAISLMLQRGSQHLKQNGEYDVEPIIKDAFAEASNCLQSKDEKKVLWKYLLCGNLSKLKLDEEDAIGYTYKCLGAGFWALKQNDFQQALQEIVMSGGDADTNAAVAGALLGCKLGSRKHVPKTWLELKHRNWLDQQIQRYLTVLKKRQEDWNLMKEEEQVKIHRQRKATI